VRGYAKALLVVLWHTCFLGWVPVLTQTEVMASGPAPTVDSMKTTDSVRDLTFEESFVVPSPARGRVLLFVRGAGDDRWQWTVLDRSLAHLSSFGTEWLGAGVAWERGSRRDGSLLAADGNGVYRHDTLSRNGDLSKVFALQRQCRLPCSDHNGGIFLWLWESGEVWRASTSDGTARRVAACEGKLSWMDVSPTGAVLAVAAGSQNWVYRPYGAGTVSLIDVADGEAVHELSDVRRCTWHPVDDALVYERSGDVWVVAAPGWQPRRVLSGAEDAAVSPDGRWIAYTKPQEAGVWVRAYSEVGEDGSRLTSFGSEPFWLGNDALGLKRSVQQESLEAGTLRYAVFTTLKLSLPETTRSRGGVDAVEGSLGVGVRSAGGVPGQVASLGSGVTVEDVVADGPAALAGVKKGDIIARYAGIRVGSAEEFAKWVRATEPGTVVELTVVRDGTPMKLKATVAGLRS
jgi:hypothetical protein